jgi:16S rRNA (adenine1518-N6/adenine1519-N6)-dimethyltransferase
MQKLGQHFLKNKSVIQKILSAIEPESGSEIFEIGPGHGELTIPLAATCEKNGYDFAAIEKDHELAEALARVLPGTKILNGDALGILPEILNARKTDGKGYKLVGNIPYYITGHLFRMIGELPNKPERCVFMIQREVADRLCAAPPEMNRLAASVQFWAVPTIVCAVPKGDFAPPPKVDSAVIMMKSRETAYEIEPERYYAAMRAIFAQPRKTILNNLSSALAEAPASPKKDSISSSLATLSIDPKARPQNLAVDAIIAIAKTFF